jgi:galactokinase
MNSAPTETENIAQLHRAEYESLPDIVVSAPGIVRMMGETTIDTEGLMLSFPMERRVSIAISYRRDSSIRFYASDLNERKRTNLSNLRYKREDRWANLIKASISAYLGEATAFKGFNITVSGDVPLGLGLGSATALRSAAAKAAALISGFDPGADEIAASIAELDRSFFDRQPRPAYYLATLSAMPDSISYVDALRGSVENLPAIFGDVRLFLTDSKVPRPPLEGELGQRVLDCAAGFSMMHGTGHHRLRDCTASELDEYMGIMPERVRRHCSFFVDEIQRVRETREAILHGDLVSFAKSMNKSQTGLRNHYEISCPEIDWLVKRALELDGVLASRMIGKGFGGCTLTVMRSAALPEYLSRLEEYERIFGFKPNALEIFIGAGMIVE